MSDDRKIAALSVVRREEEDEAQAQYQEADRQIGNDNTAAYEASRKAEEAAENANNLAEAGAGDGHEEAKYEEPPYSDS